MCLDTLDDDKIWQQFKTSHPDAEDMVMAQLLSSKARIVESTNTAEEAKTPITAQSPRKQESSTRPKVLPSSKHKPKVEPPGPPTLVSVSVILILDLYEMKNIQDSLSKLNDAKLLMQARNASNFFEFSIVRWTLKRSAMAYGNAVTGTCHVQAIEVPRKDTSIRYTPQLDEKALFECLTLKNVRDLGRFELPEITNPAPIGRRVAQDVDFSPGSLPRDPYLATIVTQVLLFLVLTYFAAFAREAVAFEGFPTRCTLFGAFSKSRWTLWIFFLALWTPTVGACAILITSLKLTLAVGIIPIALVSVGVHRILQSRSFFEPLNPRNYVSARLQFWRRTPRLDKNFRDVDVDPNGRTEE